MNDFKINNQNLPNGILIEIKGNIDEKADFSKINIQNATTIVIDLRFVTRINSIGIRSWMQWFRNNLTGKSITFRACPKVIVNQFNLIMDFLPKQTKVESFMLPFYCETCKIDKSIECFAGKEFDQATRTSPGVFRAPPEPICETCKAPLEPDFNTRQYTAFLHKV